MTRLLPVTLALLLTAAACASSPSSAPSGSGAPRPTGPRAQAGDTVYLIEYHIKPDRRPQFDDFVRTMLWPALERAAGQRDRAGLTRQTRLLQPVLANEDGTFTYTFLLDPPVPGESYDVHELLRAFFANDDRARQEYIRFTEMWARDFTARPFVQAGRS